MGFFNKYPYTDCHEMNLDWFLKEFKPLMEKYESIQSALDEFIETFGDKLTETVKNRLSEMAADGSLAQLLREVAGVNTYETDYVLFGRVPTPNAVITGKEPEWVPEAIENNRLKDCIKIGANTFQNCDDGISDCIGIGTGVMSEHQAGNHNIGIGMFALSHLNSTGLDTNGDRNIAIGSYSYIFGDDIRTSVAIGRDVGQNVHHGSDNTLVGYNSMGGVSPVGLDGQIADQVAMTCNKVTTLGARAMKGSNDANNTVAIGASAAINVKNSSRNVFIGSNSALSVGSDVSYNGKNLVSVSDTGTYSASGNTINVTCSGHQAVAGCYVLFQPTSGELKDLTTGNTQLLYVSSVSASGFVLITPFDLNGSGNCAIHAYETNDAITYECTENVVIGNNAAQNAGAINNSTVIGSAAMSTVTESIEYATIVGRNAGYDKCESVDSSVMIGAVANNTLVSSERDVLIGNYAGNAAKNSAGNTFVGYGAGREMIDGTDDVDISGSTAIGTNAKVSGNNEVQLGGVGTTPYAYAALQVRSDERDKVDIKDETLGLEFIKALRPVQYKVDPRDAYKGFDNSSHEHCGTREHNGFIAQEVKAVADKLGIDFAGYQDHTVNGGCDVKTLAYEELIAPMVKAIQELSAEVERLKK